MNFWQYIFRFLYVRNWHTGGWELSPRRLYWLVAGIVVTISSISLIVLMQLPITFDRASL